MRDSEQFFDIENFAPGLRQLVEGSRFDPKKFVSVAVPVRNPNERPLVPALRNRSEIALTQGDETWSWQVDSLRTLFRGEKVPPALGDIPNAYIDCLMLLEMHVLEISRFFGDRRDSEMKEIYSALRRRPDGKSLGFVHDYMWQAAALMLGTHVLSEAEFETILSRLERSCRTFEQGSTSRNYIEALKMTMEQGD